MVNPGISWVVTDVNYPEVKVKEISIRPAGQLTLGLHIPIQPHIALTLDARGEMTITDNETTASGEELNVTGDFVSVMGGVKVYF